jgi:translation initiation factor 1 (eIF-1/SUI1)
MPPAGSIDDRHECAGAASDGEIVIQHEHRSRILPGQHRHVEVA